ncbi:MAG: SagB/ThcOx family dehydrogenase [Anaerolineales bacterium]|nr:SagB/ThcOx family dehydrogenase [Anaerolineales bacterium]
MSIGKDFLKMTQYKNMGEYPRNQGLPRPESYTKLMECAPTQPLPDITRFGNPIKELIGQRVSLRQYKDTPISQEELAFLLWSTQGVKGMVEGKVSKRTVPSAGARHPFETVLLVNQVDKLSSGLYQYYPYTHELADLDAESDIGAKLAEACLGQKMIQESAVTFFWVAEAMRTVWRYGERGYRYIFLDAGHVCQNLYLAAESIDCGVCAIGAYDDDAVNNLLGLDGENRYVPYIATLGIKP